MNGPTGCHAVSSSFVSFSYAPNHRKYWRGGSGRWSRSIRSSVLPSFSVAACATTKIGVAAPSD